jgi:RimJ/RimL family protein N-acetyltransferase
VTRIETERLIIRRVRPGDVDVIVAIWCDPEVMTFMGGPRDPEKVRQLLLEECVAPARQFALWAVEERDTRRLVGDCGLLPKRIDQREEIEIVYLIARAHWGRGLATEAAATVRDHAFCSLGLSRLVALIDPDNGASRRVAEKIGLVHERDVVRPGGRTMRLHVATRQ